MNSPEAFEKLINEREMCEMLGIGPATAARWRYEGRGPRFIVLGPRRVAYRPSVVKEWMDRREVQQGVAKDVDAMLMATETAV